MGKRNSSKMIVFMMDVRNTIALGMTITKATIKNRNIYVDLAEASSSRFKEWDSASSLDSAVQRLWRRDHRLCQASWESAGRDCSFGILHKTCNGRYNISSTHILRSIPVLGLVNYIVNL
jgi:hypothetical protein